MLAAGPSRPTTSGPTSCCALLTPACLTPAAPPPPAASAAAVPTHTVVPFAALCRLLVASPKLPLLVLEGHRRTPTLLPTRMPPPPTTCHRSPQGCTCYRCKSRGSTGSVRRTLTCTPPYPGPAVVWPHGASQTPHTMDQAPGWGGGWGVSHLCQHVTGACPGNAATPHPSPPMVHTCTLHMQAYTHVCAYTNTYTRATYTVHTQVCTRTRRSGSFIWSGRLQQQPPTPLPNTPRGVDRPCCHAVLGRHQCRCCWHGTTKLYWGTYTNTMYSKHLPCQPAAVLLCFPTGAQALQKERAYKAQADRSGLNTRSIHHAAHPGTAQDANNQQERRRYNNAHGSTTPQGRTTLPRWHHSNHKDASTTHMMGSTPGRAHSGCPVDTPCLY